MFEIYQDSASEFRFRLRAVNGEIILSSEGYTAKSSALNGIESVRTHVAMIANFDLRTAANGEFYFVLKASNGEPIGVSELYSSSAARAIGQYSVERAAPAGLCIFCIFLFVFVLI